MLKYLPFCMLISLFSVFAISAQTAAKTPDSSSWESSLQSLLETHGVLLNQLNISASSDQTKSEQDNIKEKLLANAQELATFFDNHVSSGSGSEFKTLFEDHIKYGGEYIDAVKNHQATDQIVKNALDNGSQIADLFSKWFPNIANNEWQKMLKEHVNIEAKLTDAYFQNNSKDAAEWKEKSLMQLKQLGDLIIKGINSNLSS